MQGVQLGEKPPCFGDKALWDPKAPECAGGEDPAYQAEDGSRKRQKCLFFEACGQKVQASRMEPARSLLDPKSLVKNNIPTLGPSRLQHNPISQAIEKFSQSISQYQVAVPPQQQQQRSVPWATPQQQQQVPQMTYGYQQMMPVNYQMPSYLSVPEERHAGEGFLQFLMRTVVRSMGKSIGHSIAHLFDTVPLSPPRVVMHVVQQPPGNEAK